jgi:serpin B
MYKRHLLSGLVLLLAGLVISVSVLYAQDLSSVVNANNQFAFELYSKYKSKEGNIFFSAYSLSSALAMTYEGARGQTADEIQSVFHFPKDDSLRRESFLKIYEQINKKDKKYQLRTANALWAQKDYKFLAEYFNLIDQYYRGKVTNLDFISQTEQSRITINNWVEEQTDNKIRNLIPPGVLNEMTRLVLTNAIYFKGFWDKQFDKKETKEEDFRTSPGNTVKVQMMSLTGEEAEFNYTETERLQILELPYEGEELSMLILLPKGDDLNALEESLNTENLSEWRNRLIEQRVEVYIPKFKFETKYFMAEDLKGMGMPTAFSMNADFSGMTGKKDLFISQVIHQAFVEVNEEGTEAAAATAVVWKGLSVRPKSIKIFKADHPFIFVIQEKETGDILFLGRVTNPTS